jgi:environmental stress-induced protein Ves
VIELLKPSDYREQRWKNGGGVTHEIAVDAEEPPAWRMSVATIESDGPFSDFRGYDRTIVAIEGSVTLSADGREIALAPFEPFLFRGETQVACTIEGSLARDFNVMTMRNEFAHDVEVVRSQARFVVDDDELVFGYALAGEARVHDTLVRAGETIYLDGVESFDVIPSDGGALALVRITPV